MVLAWAGAGAEAGAGLRLGPSLPQPPAQARTIKNLRKIRKTILWRPWGGGEVLSSAGDGAGFWLGSPQAQDGPKFQVGEPPEKGLQNKIVITRKCLPEALARGGLW